MILNQMCSYVLILCLHDWAICLKSHLDQVSPALITTTALTATFLSLFFAREEMMVIFQLYGVLPEWCDSNTESA